MPKQLTIIIIYVIHNIVAFMSKLWDIMSTICKFTFLKIKQKLCQGYMQVNKYNFISGGKIDSIYYTFIYSNLFISMILINLCQGLLFSGKQQSTKTCKNYFTRETQPWVAPQVRVRPTHLGCVVKWIGPVNVRGARISPCIC